MPRWKELPKSIRNIEGYSPTRGKMFFTDINGNHNLFAAVVNIFLLQATLYQAAMVSRWSGSQELLSLTLRTLWWPQ